MEKVIGYGVNVQLDNDKFRRFRTLENEQQANEVFNILTNPENEFNPFKRVEIEKISKNEYGTFEYEVIKQYPIKVHDISTSLDIFGDKMKQKYDFINDFTYEETYYDNNEEYHRYNCWLKFPYASTDSGNGFFSFHTEEQFNYYINTIYKFKIEDVLEERIDFDTYSEFLNTENYLKTKVKAIDLIYKN